MKTLIKFFVLIAVILMVVFGWIFYLLSHWPIVAWMFSGALIWWLIERIINRVRKARRNIKKRAEVTL